MKQAVAIVTDGTCDLPPELVAEHRIQVVRQYITWGQRSYIDYVELPIDEFYQRLAVDPEIPKTSQATTADFVQGYQEARRSSEAQGVICITLSAELSGTHNSAVQAAEIVDFPVRVVDSRIASLPLGFLVLTAVEARDAGGSLDEIAEIIEAARPAVQIFFTPDTLRYLHLGGRVSSIQRFIGDTLKIKPILYVVDGKIEVKTSVRARHRAIQRILGLVDASRQGHRIKRLGVMHGSAHHEAAELAHLLRDCLGVEEVIVNSCCSAIGVHMGPGVIGIGYQLEPVIN
ncbi:MAG: DegV family protein [Chloroflexi bacterium]|nr:DegV family protein [Chloroflexota bacterium]